MDEIFVCIRFFMKNLCRLHVYGFPAFLSCAFLSCRLYSKDDVLESVATKADLQNYISESRIEKEDVCGGSISLCFFFLFSDGSPFSKLFCCLHSFVCIWKQSQLLTLHACMYLCTFVLWFNFKNGTKAQKDDWSIRKDQYCIIEVRLRHG